MLSCKKAKQLDQPRDNIFKSVNGAADGASMQSTKDMFVPGSYRDPPIGGAPVDVGTIASALVNKRRDHAAGDRARKM